MIAPLYLHKVGVRLSTGLHCVVVVNKDMVAKYLKALFGSMLQSL